MLQEPKRHSSDKILSSSEGFSSPLNVQYSRPTPPGAAAGVSPMKTAGQYYGSKLGWGSGVSTPPAQGCPYYPPTLYQPHLLYQSPVHPHYSSGALPQAVVQGFQSFTLDDPNAQYLPIASSQYVQSAGYYPMYMGYSQPAYASYIAPQAAVASTLQPGGVKHQQPPLRRMSSGRRKTLTKPSQFRPQAATYMTSESEGRVGDGGNEAWVLSIISDFEASNHDTSCLVGKLGALAVTQTGSRFLQKQLATSNPDFVPFVLQEVGTELKCRSNISCPSSWSTTMPTTSVSSSSPPAPLHSALLF